MNLPPSSLTSENNHGIDLLSAFEDLTDKGWVEIKSFVPPEVCHVLLADIQQQIEEDKFRPGAIGKGIEKTIKKKIRDSEIFWIDNWDRYRELQLINKLLSSMMVTINQNFLLSMKRLESQFAYYSEGGFYKKHLDQHHTKHRQVTCIFYLNDCPQGGELVVYNQDDKNITDAIITPSIGSCVLFFSKLIFHEVLPTKIDRYSLTTWMRDDAIPFI